MKTEVKTPNPKKRLLKYEELKFGKLYRAYSDYETYGEQSRYFDVTLIAGDCPDNLDADECYDVTEQTPVLFIFGNKEDFVYESFAICDEDAREFSYELLPAGTSITINQ